MNAATRIRASWSGWRRGGAGVVVGAMVGVVGVVGVVVGVVGVVVAFVVAGRNSRRPEDGTVTGMTPIRYVTDRFGFLYDRTGR